jgi:hypothetical protein
MLENRDYTLIIDKSGSMAAADGPGGQTRWAAVQESTFALASKCEQFDPDGITVYMFCNTFERTEGVTSAKVGDLFRANKPGGSTALGAVLNDAFDSYFRRKAKGQTKPAGEIILVITDGAPDNQDDVIHAIIRATERMQSDEELAVTFLQIGKDEGAAEFLKKLDEELTGGGEPEPAAQPAEKPGFFSRLFGSKPTPPPAPPKAKRARFDICDTITFEDMEELSLTEILMNAIQD